MDRRIQLARFVIGHCYLVVVTTDNQSSAYRIIAVMNDRGSTSRLPTFSKRKSQEL